MSKSLDAEAARVVDAPLPAVPKPDLLGVEDAKRLGAEEVADLFKAHLNPGQLRFLQLLGFDDVVVERAEGMYYTDQKGRRILDFFGGFGSLAFGHNHPRILEARRRFQEEKRHEIAIAFMSQYATTLAKNLAAIAPDDLDMVFFGSTGSEAVEAALKLAERHQGRERPRIVYASQAFHGKTRGALSVTDSDFYRGGFRLLSNTTKVPFGDLVALERAFLADPSIGTVILETVQGGAGVIPAPPEYWQGVRELCDRHDVLWIADEVQCGVGRTGRFFAFEHAGVTPDIVTLAKSLGGGKCAMAAMIARRPVYMRAYGSPNTALIHGPATFGGIGEACITSIEALNVLYDEGLIDNAAEQGAHLIARLEDLQKKYPSIIKDVRGQGLMVGVEFHDFSETLPVGLKQAVSVVDDLLKGSLCGFIGNLLFAKHQILVAFTEYNRNVIRLEPPLIVKRDEIDTFVDALDQLLAGGVTQIVSDFLKGALNLSKVPSREDEEPAAVVDEEPYPSLAPMEVTDKRDVAGAAHLHAALLPESPVPRMGDRFMRKFYYPQLVGSGLIHCQLCVHESQYVGFIVYTDRPGEFMSRGIRQHFGSLVGALWQLPFQPSRLRIVRDVLKEGRRRQRATREKVGEILTMGVLPAYRGRRFGGGQQSIASRMLEQVTAHFAEQGMERVQLVVRSGDVMANAFFESHGFTIEDANYPAESYLLSKKLSADDA